MPVSLIKSFKDCLKANGLNEFAKAVSSKDISPVTPNQLVDQYGLDVLTNTSKEDLLIDEEDLLKDFTEMVLNFDHVVLKLVPSHDFSEENLASLLRSFILKSEEIKNNYSSLFKESINIDHYLAVKYDKGQLGIFAVKGKVTNYFIFYSKLTNLLTQTDLDKLVDKLFSDMEYNPDEIKKLREWSNQLRVVYKDNKQYLNSLLELTRDRVLYDQEARAIFKLVSESQLLLDY
jgi:hypothetical protein